jgi:hypothetical protein
MLTMKKAAILFLAVLLLALPLISIVQANQAPYPVTRLLSSYADSSSRIVWEKQYGDMVAYASNLIQTSDGGYAFLDTGGATHGYFRPAVLYKVDSLGNTQWNKTLDYFIASNIIQTNDEGYEISGLWLGVDAWTNPEPNTLIKTDSLGKLQWSLNYSSPSMLPLIGSSSINIKTTDGGFAYASNDSIVKLNSINQTMWAQPLTFIEHAELPNVTHDTIYPLSLSSLIETSDGSLAGIGVGHHIPYKIYVGGYICLIKMEAFLPTSSSIDLPTPLQTLQESPITGNSKYVFQYSIPITIAAILAVSAVTLGILVFFKNRKSKTP